MKADTNKTQSDTKRWGRLPTDMTKLLDAAHFKTYAALACYAGFETRLCFPSMRRLAQDTASNKSTVKDHVRTLCAVGAITKLRRGGWRHDGNNQANDYRINDYEDVLSTVGLTPAMLDMIKPPDVPWVVKARAGCEVPPYCPSESSLPAERRGSAEAYHLAEPWKACLKPPVGGWVRMGTTEGWGVLKPHRGVGGLRPLPWVARDPQGGWQETPTVGGLEAYTTDHRTENRTNHLTESITEGDINSNTLDTYGAFKEGVAAHSDSSALFESEDVSEPSVSSVSLTPQVRDSASAAVDDSALSQQTVSANGPSSADVFDHGEPPSFEPETPAIAPPVEAHLFGAEAPAVTAQAEQWSYARELVSYARGPYEVDVALLAKVPICYQEDICKALAGRDVGYIYGPMRAARAATDDDVLDAMSGVNVVLPTAPLWFVAVCKELGLSITAMEVSSEAA